MDAQSVYPTDVGPVVLGEIWAPRLFAKGLDTLELGGDGAVAFSADGHRAFALDVTSVPEADGVAAHDRTDVLFAQPAFKLGTALEVAPEDNVALTGTDLSLDATGALRVTGGDSVSMTAAGGVDMTGATVNLVAVGDVILTSDGNPTVVVKGDRVVIKGDVEVTGALEMGAGSGDGTMAVGSNILELADKRELEITGMGEGTQQGIQINTAPDATDLIASGALDEYLRKFTDTSGQPVFYTDDAFDATKYAAANGVLYKGLLFNVNGGSGTSGKKTLASRMQEPFWDVSGGAMKISRTVPTADTVTKMSMAFRVTDAGELEVVRHKAPYAYADGAYTLGESEDVQVLARWGHLVQQPTQVP